MDEHADTSRRFPPITGELFDQLRSLASLHLTSERPGHTLQPTALVNEALLRLAGRRHTWSGPGHVYSAAAEAMERVLIDYARGRARQKRGGGRQVPLRDVSDLVAVAESGDFETLVALEDAIRRFSHLDARAADAVRLFAGLDLAQIAIVLGVSAIRCAPVIEWHAWSQHGHPAVFAFEQFAVDPDFQGRGRGALLLSR